ncbi:excalibur calcium-binding domain-containing protein [Streptomyces sp. NPDC058486]|uniref:excalibur calcium-binding domain-containing protein n=1 Tax=unclassified Streptomyces TaxID=2593676 RepID=UPI00365F76FF
MRDQIRDIHEGGRPHRRRRRGSRTSIAALGVIAAITLTACAGNERAPEHTFDVAPYIHKGHVVDCDTFKSQADAQAVLRADTLDPNELDRDGDGIACPTLPAPTDKTPVHRDFRTDLDGAPISDPIKPPPK